ncbi:hypothetical protein [Isoptericola croceus]|uniref:hypothetical protein n=1 Tax=Isoptericola croceus TaxID=3031406 RepID=UPI0023F61EDE|nr:hypothetical protein [Isoptericola croceus]
MNDVSEQCIPERSTLVHIGLPKTGSTSLQYAAHQLRRKLMGFGVRYPAGGVNHHKGGSWLIDAPLTYLSDPAPRREWWTSLASDMDKHSTLRRLLSFEMFCTADIDGVRKVRENIDGEVQVVLVIRNLGDFVPSYWQETLKRGSTSSLEEYARRYLQDPREIGVSGAFHRSDDRWLVARWVEVFGAENVTVVVLDRSAPSRLFDAFESMLGLPGSLLSSATVDHAETNRGMSFPEASLVLEINRRLLEDWSMPRTMHRKLVYRGLVERILGSRQIGPKEDRLRLPVWAAEACAEAGALLSTSIQSLGVQVVGELSEIDRQVDGLDTDQAVLPGEVPVDLALEALLGVLSRASGWNAAHTEHVPSSIE